MSAVKKRSFISITLLCIFAVFSGLFLPRFVSWHEDNLYQSQIKQYALKENQFNEGNSFWNVVNLMQSSFVTVNVSQEKTKHTAEEIWTIEKELFQTFDSYGLPLIDSTAIVYHNEYSYMAVADQSSMITDAQAYSGEVEGNDTPDKESLSAAIYWHCYVETSYGVGINLKIDDASGKLLSFDYFDNSGVPYVENSYYEEYQKILDLFIYFFESYYSCNYVNSNSTSYIEKDNVWYCTFILQNEDEIDVSCNLFISNYSISFSF